MARVVRETAAVSSIYLAAPDGTALPAAQARTVPDAAGRRDAGQPAPVRSYSLSSAPGASRYRISVKLEPHGAVSST